MHLLCAFGWHRPESTTIRNDGRHFGRCRRCKSDLIEGGLGWKRAPRGYRVVWKKSGGEIPPAATATPKAVPESVADAAPASDGEASAPAPRVRRARAGRRAAQAAQLPSRLAGNERDATRGRRKPRGKKPDPRPA